MSVNDNRDQISDQELINPHHLQDQPITPILAILPFLTQRYLKLIGFILAWISSFSFFATFFLSLF